MSDPFEISYAAHTASCTFLLDAAGICRRIVVPVSRRSGRDGTRAASRCVGAQYVAALDATVSGMLAEMPRVGSTMLFARVDERGRISLVRTGVITQFDRHRAEDPFAEPDHAPSASVETSAPVLPPSSPPPSPRRRDSSISIRDPYSDDTPAARTQAIAAVRAIDPSSIQSRDVPSRRSEPVVNRVRTARNAEPARPARYPSEKLTAAHRRGPR